MICTGLIAQTKVRNPLLISSALLLSLLQFADLRLRLDVILDEGSHEDSLRALAKGGFDEVLNAIGTYLGLDHLVAFSIGILAVTKADKGVRLLCPDVAPI